MKKNSNSQMKSERNSKRMKASGPVQGNTKEVMAELVAKLTERLGANPAQESATEAKPRSAHAPAPNRDRLTVGVDLGDQWSNYCILGLEGETLAEGQLRTTPERFCRIVPGIIGRARGHGSGDPLRLGTRSSG